MISFSENSSLIQALIIAYFITDGKSRKGLLKLFFIIFKLIRNNGLTAFSPSSTKMLILTEDLVEWCRQHPNGEPDSEAKLSDNQKKKGPKK